MASNKLTTAPAPANLCWDCDGYKGFFLSDAATGLPEYHRCPSCHGTGLRCAPVATPPRSD
jgi:hypothetical protein